MDGMERWMFSQTIEINDRDEWRIDKTEVDIFYDQWLGQGEFGIVYKGQWRGMIVAVKQFHPINVHKIRLMQNEFEAMTKLHHPHIIQLLGYLEDPFSIVMEYVSKGSLSCYLKKQKWTSLATKIKFMIDIALGLTYLHQRQPSYIIHRDIKPSNFLVTEDLHIKIADFGICKILQKTYKSSPSLVETRGTPIVGTFFYMAPELFNDAKKGIIYHSKIDLYSFGSVMYEVFEGRKLFGDCSSKQEFFQCIQDKIAPSFLKTPSFLRPIILECLNHDPAQRPDAMSIVYRLRQFLQKYWWLKLRR